MITHLLKKISYEDLTTLIEIDKLKQMTELVSCEHTHIESLAKDVLINAIEASFGTEVLNDKRVRQLVFYSLDEPILFFLTNKYGKKSYPKAYDNAIELSLLPWKAGSDFVNEVAEVLNIPNGYLPQITFQNPTTEEISPCSKFYHLHDYQEELKDKIIQHLTRKTKRFLVQMPTGSGKTRSVLQAIIEFLNNESNFNSTKCIIWLAHTEELCEQAIDTFKYLWEHLSTFSVRISRLWGNHNPDVENLKGAFVVGTLQKFISLEKSESFILNYLKESCEIVVIDEAHKSVARSYASMINNLIENNSTTLLGITATPGRTTANELENKKLAYFFNKVLISPTFDGNPIVQLQKKGILSHLKRIAIITNIDVTISSRDLQQVYEDEDLPQSTLRKLALNTKRNRIIINIIQNELEKGNPTLLFSCNTEHSKLLNAALNLKGIKSFYLDANTSKLRRKQIIEDFRKGDFDILINYGILSTGFDAPRIRSIIVTRPTSSVVLYSQIIGRGLRGPKMGGSYECNLFDIKDNFINFGGVEDVYEYFDGYWD